MATITLDSILGLWSPGAQYEVYKSEEPENNWEGFWFSDWVPGENSFPEPSYEQVLGISKTIQESGLNQTMDSAIEGFSGILQTSAFKKIIYSTPSNPAITVLGIVALGAMMLYLRNSTEELGLQAKTAWQQFAAYANSQRDLTQITDEDIAELNSMKDSYGLPTWLRLPETNLEES